MHLPFIKTWRRCRRWFGKIENYEWIAVSTRQKMRMIAVLHRIRTERAAGATPADPAMIPTRGACK
jgi:hypothetical protein